MNACVGVWIYTLTLNLGTHSMTHPMGDSWVKKKKLLPNSCSLVYLLDVQPHISGTSSH